jgi:hypothetical protein
VLGLDQAGECSYSVHMPKPRQPDTRPSSERSLREVAESHLLIFLECGWCLRLSSVDILDAAWRCSPDAPLKTLARRAVCASCGRKQAVPLLYERTARNVGKWQPREPLGKR